MKRAIIICIEIALLVAVLQSSFVQHMLQGTQATVSGWFLSIADVADNRALAGLREDMEPFTHDLDEQQKAYLYEVTHNLDKLKQFNRMYCIGSDKNPFVYGDTLRQFCAQIRSNSLLTRS